MTPIPTPTRRHLALAAALVATAVATAACGAAQTDEQYQAGVGANVRTGAVQLYNAVAKELKSKGVRAAAFGSACWVGAGCRAGCGVG